MYSNQLSVQVELFFLAVVVPQMNLLHRKAQSSVKESLCMFDVFIFVQCTQNRNFCTNHNVRSTK